MLNANEYKLKNGTIVNIKDLSNLTADERTELFITPLNMYEGLQIKNDLAVIKSSLDKTLEALDTHTLGCPVHKDAVNDMIDSRMKTNIKETILTSGNIAKAITTVFVLVAGIGTLFFILFKNIN